MENIFHQQGSNSHPEGMRHCCSFSRKRGGDSGQEEPPAYDAIFLDMHHKIGG